VVTVVGPQYAADLPKPGHNVILLCRQALYRLGECQKTFGQASGLLGHALHFAPARSD
jgi:hypothetical protein